MFQFTRARGARRADADSESGLRVSIHARTGRATRLQRHRAMVHPVSIHARTGRATLDGRMETRADVVSIHARTGRATMACEYCVDPKEFQFTRARGARPGGGRRGPGLLVSIHARTGRATRFFCGLTERVKFQFTRARGARPRAVRCDALVVVSIHARTGRATIAFAAFVAAATFQFTRARGARRTTTGLRSPSPCFNSRAHGARDRRADADSESGLRVSIHARTGRATATRRAEPCATCFNSRAHGARDICL